MSKKKSNPKKLQNKPTQTIVTSTPELAEISIKNISCSSRVSFKQGEAYYTFEYKEEIALPPNDMIDIDKERAELWQRCHKEVDKQVDEILNL